MDPNEALEQLRQSIADLTKHTADWEPGEDVDRDALIETAIADTITTFVGLDEWLSRDGFLPRDWWDEEAKDRG